MSQLMSVSQKQMLFISIFLFALSSILYIARNLSLASQYYRSLYIPEIDLIIFLLVLGATTGNLLLTVILLFQRKWKTSIIFVTLFFCGIISIAIVHIYDGSSILYAI